MRLIELEIDNVRGIRHLELKPQGENFAVWGPNGSGKSAVVDAIDFLLTGGITRLTGKGTGDITLKKHGAHIDCEPDEAKVRAVIQVKGNKKTVEISRCMGNPKTLVIEENADTTSLEPILKLAQRGHHVLTRREILKYITAEGSTRAEEIQHLLNISEIENIRKAFVKVQNDFLKDLKAARKALQLAEGAVCATLGITSFDKKVALFEINHHRAVFGKPKITEPRSAEIKKELSLPHSSSGDQTINVTLSQNDIDNLKNALDPSNQELITKSDTRLRSLLDEIRKNPKMLRTLSLRELISLGIGLIDETGICPLCETAWPPGELHTLLESRLASADAAQQTTSEVEKLVKFISVPVSSVLASLKKVVAIVGQMDLKDELCILEKWQTDLLALSEDISSPISKYPREHTNTTEIARLMAPKDIEMLLDKVALEVKAEFPEATPEQTSWDTLTRLEENLKALETAQQQFNVSDLQWGRTVTLNTKFEIARDSILSTLYEEIKDRFVKLYKFLHEDDEGSFTANITPSGAALDIEVDFHGRGVHPPHALHSEGHQDSMGLCLYLALAERLTGGLLDLVILDDVIMSVDADHRRQLCNLLASAFPNRQFLMTTHDKTWSSQLRYEGVVRSKSMVEFFNWNIEFGPQVNTEAELWDQLKEDFGKNNIPAAAARLRHGSEEYFSLICDALQAPVKFKINGRWELGDLLPAAMKQYRHLLKLSKNSANSWNLKERVAELEEINSIASSIFARTNAEQWAVNANVHYNNWANFTPNDFQPVAEAFQDLFSLYRCINCGGIIYLSVSGMEPVNVRCNCGKFTWNLVVKKKES